jgi:hypothetical protein
MSGLPFARRLGPPSYTIHIKPLDPSNNMSGPGDPIASLPSTSHYPFGFINHTYRLFFCLLPIVRGTTYDSSFSHDPSWRGKLLGVEVNHF